MSEFPYIQEIVEHLSVERKKRLDNAIFGEIKEIIKDNSLDTVIVLDETAIVKALEKQIPKKVISFKRTAHDFQNDICKHSGYPCDHIKTFNIEYQYTDYKCPVCGKIATDGEPSYCWNCGQALDWSDTE